MKTQVHSIISKVMTCVLLLPFALNSCGKIISDELSTSEITSAEPETEKSGYEYPALDLGGRSLDILNNDAIYEIYMYLDLETMTGEILDDTVYERNRFIEEKFNCEINVTEYPSGGSGFEALTKHAASLILSGDDTYEVMYIKVAAQLDLLTGGGLLDLGTLPELNFGEDWWDRIVVDNAEINGKLYFATGSLHLMPFESTWCIYFNENLFEKYGVDQPYDLVRDGVWTLDKLIKLCREGSSLNGDESYEYTNGGDALYGISCHSLAVPCMLYSAGIRYAEPDGESFKYALGTDKFYKIADQISEFTSSSGAFFKGSDDVQNEKGYTNLFKNDRSMFVTAQIKTANSLRDMNSEFGIIPFPKADESQSEYYSYVTGNNLVMTIPVTNQTPNETAAVIDALTYRSYEKVLPVYYENTVGQKGLRNSDSIEMLDYIRRGRGIDIADYFLWNGALSSELRGALLNSTGNVTSVIAANSQKVQAEIDKFIEKMK